MATNLNERPRSAIRDARNAWVVARPLYSWSLTMLSLCLLLALLGAVNSYGIPLEMRLVFWGGLFAVALVFSIGIEAALLRAGLPLVPAWRWAAVFILILAAAMTPVAYAANSLGRWAPLSMLVPHFGNSVLISAASVGMRIGIGRMAYEDQGVPRDLTRSAPLMDRLSHGLRDAGLQAIEADGHYIRVHTDRGAEMVLMRLKDAIRETTGVEGMQIHRGWWVARKAVEDFRPIDGKPQLVLSGGQQVPVSRSRRAELREAGWL